MTDIYILNTDYETVGIIDNYSSAIFTSRYWEYGDFELYIKANRKSLSMLQPNYYVKREGDSYTYIVETIQLTTNQEDGDFLTVKGRSAESILDRRILYNHRSGSSSGSTGGFMVTYPIGDYTTVEDCIYHALEMTIAPSNTMSSGDRWVWDGNVVLSEKQGYSEPIADLQIYGQNVYDFVTEQCQLYEYGFKLQLNQSKQFEFSLYKGRDCSYSQSENPYIVFSPEFDNLLNSDYTFDNTNLKNCILTAGEGDGDERFWYGCYRNDGDKQLYYIDRREVFVDNKSLSSKELTTATYRALLRNTARGEIIKYNTTESLEGEVATTTRNYQLGDIVQIENEYGIQATARILEIIECEDESGYSIVPTFSTWEV